MAERSYIELSTVLRHQFRERKPIILYASLSDFQQTNTSPEEVSEGTGGFTDFLKHRIVIPADRVVRRRPARAPARNDPPVPVRRLVGRAGRRRGADDHRGQSAALVRRGHGGVHVAGRRRSQHGDVAARRRAGRQGPDDPPAGDRSADLPVPLRPGDPDLHRPALGRRGDRRDPVRVTLRIARRRVPACHRARLQAARRPVARCGRQGVPAAAQYRGQGDRDFRCGADQGTQPGHAAPGPGALARRHADRVLLGEGLLLRRPLAGERRRRQGGAPAVQVHVEFELRDVPVHQLLGELVAGRQVPRVRRQERRA